MKLELVVATKNKKKLEEIKEILKGLDLKIIPWQITQYSRGSLKMARPLRKMPLKRR